MSRDATVRALTLLALAAAAAGCTAAPDLAPHLDHLTPAGGAAGAAATVLVHGSGFHPLAVQAASGGPAVLDTTQAAWLDGVALDGVTWLDEGTLRLTVPAGLAVGPHELTVQNGLGRRASLPGAWTVIVPAALAATARLSAAPASTGQALALTVALRNDGGTAVQGVSLSVTPSGAGGVAVGALPAAVEVPGGGSVEVVVPLTAQRAGEATLAISARGTEAFTGRVLQADPGDLTLTVQARAALTAALSLPATVTAASPFTVTMTVANDGEVAALGVAPGALALAAGAGGLLPILGAAMPGRADIPGHGSATFTWSAQLTSGAAVVLSGGAAGTDASDGATAEAAPATSNAAVPQVSATLAVSAALDRPRASTGQRVGVLVTVRNTGPVAVKGIALTFVTQGTGSLTGDVPPAAFDLAPGTSSNLTMPFTAAAAGQVAVGATAAGLEGVTGLAISAAQDAGSIEVEDRASLEASLAIPATIGSGSSFMVTMTVFNRGAATARSVAPGALAMTADGTATLASLAGPSPAQADVAGQGSATFTWAARLQAGGTVELLGGAAGTDANDGGPVVAVPVESNVGGQAPEVTLVSADPLGDGSATGQLAAHAGLLWVGPSGDGTRFVTLDPATGVSAARGLQVAVDTGASPAANTWWQGHGPATTLGGSGCARNTSACGPNDEADRGLLAGGAALGSDWLLYAGVTVNQVQHFYLASGAATPLALQSVDLSAGGLLPATVAGATAATFAPSPSGDRIYLAMTDVTAKKSPYLIALSTAPSGGWLDAAAGTDVVELGTAGMTGLGGNGSLVASADSQPRIDVIQQFRGLIYVAGGGAIWRSTVARPRSYASSAGDWALTGPLTWSAKTSIAESSATALAPADRAVPALAAFGACGAGPCLFMARNVKGSGTLPAVVPQLWRCDPTANGGDDACDIFDWSQAVPNTGGDRNLTQLNVATRGAVSVLLATASYLYLGLDDATTGAQLFRTQTLPTAISSFKGKDGCAAGTAGCTGLGGPGLGNAAMTRLLGAQAITVGGKTTVYVLAAGATGPQRLYAIGE